MNRCQTKTQFPRYEVNAYVDYTGNEMLLFHRIQNISLGGVCIKTSGVEEIGTIVDLVLNFPDLDASIADFNAALALNPRLANSLYGRGIAKRRKGDLAGAEADLAAAKAMHPGVAQEFAKSEIE